MFLLVWQEEAPRARRKVMLRAGRHATHHLVCQCLQLLELCHPRGQGVGTKQQMPLHRYRFQISSGEAARKLLLNRPMLSGTGFSACMQGSSGSTGLRVRIAHSYGHRFLPEMHRVLPSPLSAHRLHGRSAQQTARHMGQPEVAQVDQPLQLPQQQLPGQHRDFHGLARPVKWMVQRTKRKAIAHAHRPLAAGGFLQQRLLRLAVSRRSAALLQDHQPAVEVQVVSNLTGSSSGMRWNVIA